MFAIGALLLAGCGPSADEIAAKKAAEEEAARAAAEAARKAAGPTEEEQRAAFRAFAAMVCGSPRLMDEAETSLDLLDAFSGEGADKAEASKQRLRAQSYFRAKVELDLSNAGQSYEALMRYANRTVLAPQPDPGQAKEARQITLASCPNAEDTGAERILKGVLRFCAGEQQ